MMTIKKLAELCGVSRGTVDRALNGRGRVSPETAEKIKKMAAELGYEPNPAAKALAARKDRPLVGIILCSEDNVFFDEVIRGLRTAAQRYEIYGMQIELKTMKGFDVDRQLALIESLAPRIQGLIITAIDDPRIAARLNRLVADKIFTVTLNMDVENCHRHCYVGSDYTNGGQTAGALLELMRRNCIPPTRIGVVMGSHRILGHRQRLEGFKKQIAQYHDFQIIEIIENMDDEFISYEQTKQLIEAHPDLNALFIVAGGVYGACRAVLSADKVGKISVVAFDTTPTTVEMMEKGVMRAAIYQHPYRQGYRAMDLCFNYLVNDQLPQQSVYILNNEIRLLANLKTAPQLHPFP